jgi:hypothetical protein
VNNIWTCKIGETLGQPLPPGADGPMRTAVEDAYLRLTGNEADFVFSGWGGELSEWERAAHEDRLPFEETDDELVNLLATAADRWGALGVARVAARMAGQTTAGGTA